MNGECLREGVIYEGKIEIEGEDPKVYIGACSTSFKLRYGNHKQSFRNQMHRGKTIVKFMLVLLILKFLYSMKLPMILELIFCFAVSELFYYFA